MGTSEGSVQSSDVSEDVVVSLSSTNPAAVADMVRKLERATTGLARDLKDLTIRWQVRCSSFLPFPSPSFLILGSDGLFRRSFSTRESQLWIISLFMTLPPWI